MIPALAHQEGLREGIYDHCRIVLGITDRQFVDELLAIELPYTPGDMVLGTGPVPLLEGDRLNTETDWMDSELLEAQERYQGKPRPSRNLSEPVNWENPAPAGELPPTIFEQPQ